MARVRVRTPERAMAEAANKQQKRALHKLAAAQEGYHERTTISATKANYISKVKRMQEVMSVNALLFPPLSEIYELNGNGNPKIMEGGVLRWCVEVAVACVVSGFDIVKQSDKVIFSCITKVMNKLVSICCESFVFAVPAEKNITTSNSDAAFAHAWNLLLIDLYPAGSPPRAFSDTNIRTAYSRMCHYKL